MSGQDGVDFLKRGQYLIAAQYMNFIPAAIFRFEKFTRPGFKVKPCFSVMDAFDKAQSDNDDAADFDLAIILDKMLIDNVQFFPGTTRLVVQCGIVS